MRTRVSWLKLVAAFTIAVAFGCTEERTVLSIDVITDLVAGPEFDFVTVEIFDEMASRSTGGEILRSAVRSIRFTDAASASRGLRVAEFAGLPERRYAARARLYRPSDQGRGVLAEQWTVFTLQGVMRVPLRMDSACLPVQCPAPGGSAAFSECVRGRCADPLCDPTDRTTWAEHCCDPSDPSADCDAVERLFCRTDSECSASSACVEPRCVEGVCLEVARDEACAPTEYCARERGCQPLPTLIDAADAGRPDASASCVFQPCELVGDPCFAHSRNCVSGACERLVARSAGTPCQGDGICSSDGACVACPGAPFCDPSSDSDGDSIFDRNDVESCDDLDNDGDGAIDERLAEGLRYADRDLDGVGTGVGESGCARPGWSNRDGDCNDASAEIAPGAPERCNGRDDDCDSTVDEASAAGLCGGVARCAAGSCGAPLIDGTQGAIAEIVTDTVDIPGSHDTLWDVAIAPAGSEPSGSIVRRVREDGTLVWQRTFEETVFFDVDLAGGDVAYAAGVHDGALTLCGTPIGDAGRRASVVVRLELRTGRCTGAFARPGLEEDFSGLWSVDADPDGFVATMSQGRDSGRGTRLVSMRDSPLAPRFERELRSLSSGDARVIGDTLVVIASATTPVDLGGGELTPVGPRGWVVAGYERTSGTFRYAHLYQGALTEAVVRMAALGEPDGSVVAFLTVLDSTGLPGPPPRTVGVQPAGATRPSTAVVRLVPATGIVQWTTILPGQVETPLGVEVAGGHIFVSGNVAEGAVFGTRTLAPRSAYVATLDPATGGLRSLAVATADAFVLQVPRWSPRRGVLDWHVLAGPRLAVEGSSRVFESTDIITHTLQVRP